MSDVGRTRVLELQTRYGLKNAVGDNRRNAITLSRVAMAFPWLACIYSLHSENPVVTDATMQQYIPVYPRAMLHPAFAAQIPRSLPAPNIEIIMGSFLLCQCIFASIVTKRPGQPAKRPSECETYTRQFANVAMSKAYVPDADRVDRMVEFHIIDQNGMLNAAVVAANNRFLTDRGDGPPPVAVMQQVILPGGGGPPPPPAGGANPYLQSPRLQLPLGQGRTPQNQ
jgi:hypothetical protein